VRTVSVFPSDFGLQRMEKERTMGPMAVMREELQKAGIQLGEEEEEEEEEEEAEQSEEAKMKQTMQVRA